MTDAMTEIFETGLNMYNAIIALYKVINLEDKGQNRSNKSRSVLSTVQNPRYKKNNYFSRASSVKTLREAMEWWYYIIHIPGCIQIKRIKRENYNGGLMNKNR